MVARLIFVSLCMAGRRTARVTAPIYIVKAEVETWGMKMRLSTRENGLLGSFVTS